MINTLLLLGILLALIGILKEEIRIRDYMKSPYYIKDTIRQIIEESRTPYYLGLRADKRFKSRFYRTILKDYDIEIKR